MALKKFKHVPYKNSCTAETGNWKRHFMKGTRKARPGVDYLTYKKQFIYSFSFQNVSLFLKIK